MICGPCIFYGRLGREHPISPACTWSPSDEQMELLRQILPAPALSRALVMPSPHQVESCGAFEEITL